MDYTSIRLSTLRGDQKTEFDIYVQINEKMILYLRQGDSFEGARLQKLKEKKLKKLYILQENELSYRQYLDHNMNQAFDNKSGKDIKLRSEIVHGIQIACIEEVFDNPRDSEAYQKNKDMAAKYVQFLLTNEKAVASIMNIENMDKNLAHHGISVSTYAVALAHRLKSFSPEQIQIIALGSLLHDIGHIEHPDLFSIPESKMTAEQLLIHRKHPQLGTDKVQAEKHIEPDVIKIISQHEECIDCSGYPMGLHETKIDPLSSLVTTCNVLDHLITIEGIPKNQACKKIMLDRVGRHPLAHIQHLADIIREIC